MNLSAAGKLRGELKKTRVCWSEIEAGWRDAVRHDFERKHIEPLESQIQATILEMGKLAEIFAKARKDCQS